MKIGIELGNELFAGQPMGPRIDALLREVAEAGDLGFDCAHVGQHYLSSPMQTIQPLPLIARLAAEAGEMALGTGILLLPLLHPVDVAEQVATLDAICGGRFIFGVGLGYEEEEFRAFGLERRDRRGRFEESLAIIKRLWTEDRVDFQGEHFSLTGVVPTARPVQKPYPPVWIAANNHPAVRRAAQSGDVWYANPHAMYSTLAHQMEIYQEALGESLVPVAHEVAVMRDGFVAESRAAAMGAVRPSIEKRYQVYREQGQDEALPPGDRFDKPFEELAKDRFIIGDPDDWIAEIKRYEALGFTYMVVNYHTLDVSDKDALACLRMLGREVLPHVR